MSRQSTLYFLFSSLNNAYSIKRRVFTVFYSRIVFLFLKELERQGLIDNFYLNPYKANELVIYPKYISGRPAFRKIVSVSKISRRVYIRASTFRYKMDKDGLYFLSTNKGFIVSNISIFNNVLSNTGGELLAKIIF